MGAPDKVAGAVVLGRYTVESTLARGPLVGTYAAVAAPNRPVVLKLYDPAQGASALSALQASAAVTRDLPRGSALEVLEVARDQDTGAALVVTERSARPSLADLVQLCPLSGDDAAAMARSLARALSGAHARGLPHLGLKPSNLFVGPSPGCDVALSDFGATLARGAKPGPGAPPELLPWLSPEQVFGGMAPGVSSDVFSAALVVFFSLTGCPYWRAFARGGDPASWVREIWEPRAPASVRSAELGHPLPPAWDAAFEGALDVDPARRPASVEALADAFTRAARGDAAVAKPTVVLPAFAVGPPPATSSAPVADGASTPAPAPRRRRAWVAAGLMAGTLLAATALVLPKLARQSAARSQPAIAPGTRASPDPMRPLPDDAAVVVPTPSASASSEPAPPPAPSVPPSAAPAVAPDPALGTLVVACRPACDSVWVDGHPAPDAVTGKAVAAGVHMVGANLARHPSRVQAVQVRRGQVTRLDVAFGR